MTPTAAQARALLRAARRADGSLCPMATPTGGAQDALIEALVRRGWADGASCPAITPAGRAAIGRPITCVSPATSAAQAHA